MQAKVLYTSSEKNFKSFNVLTCFIRYVKNYIEVIVIVQKQSNLICIMKKSIPKTSYFHKRFTFKIRISSFRTDQGGKQRDPLLKKPIGIKSNW